MNQIVIENPNEEKPTEVGATGDIKRGFVYERLRAEINKAAKQKWERDLSGFTSDKAQRDSRVDKDAPRQTLTGTCEEKQDRGQGHQLLWG
jgi:hypothetical protein